MLTTTCDLEISPSDLEVYVSDDISWRAAPQVSVFCTFVPVKASKLGVPGSP